METVAHTRRIGGSLVITLPKEVVRAEGLQEDEIIKIEVKKIKRDYFGALKGIGKFTKEDELDTHE